MNFNIHLTFYPNSELSKKHVLNIEKDRKFKTHWISTLFKRIVINLRKKKLVVTEYNRDSIYKLVTRYSYPELILIRYAYTY